LTRSAALGTVLALAATACAAAGEAEEQSRVVTATAYNSLPGQTAGNPAVGAWGDRLRPGMKAVAVSRDLLELGLRRGTRLRIEGLSGEYVVLDKMGKRWKNKVDIYMGEDVEAARAWGRRRVRIRWTPAPAQ
jgi:3D (Asp-Asp-Asp) domain-containing protein